MNDRSLSAPTLPVPQLGSPPTLGALFGVFLGVGMQSFGGGLTGWIRREVVQRRQWMSDQQLLSGLALCQIAPGPNAVNLAVFVGTTLRGRAGAAVALAGIIGLPMGVAMALAAGFARVHDLAGLDSAMAGVGAAAIGFSFATGLRMARRGLRGAAGFGVALGATLAIGVFGANFLATVAVLLPVSVGLAAIATQP